MASHLVILITAAFEAQYAAVERVSNSLSEPSMSLLTSCRPSDNSELRGYTHNRPSGAWSAIVRRQRLLLQHLLDLCSRTKPASSVVNIVDPIKLLQRRHIRFLVVAQHT